MKRIVALTVAIACGLGLTDARSADAAVGQYALKTYEVQVEYWFFDYPAYHWETVYSSEDQAAAEFVYNILQIAKENGALNQAAPNSYWRFIAVDVRMIVKWKNVAGNMAETTPPRTLDRTTSSAGIKR